MYAMEEIKTEEIDDIDVSAGPYNSEAQTNNLYAFQDDAEHSDLKQMESDEFQNESILRDSLSNYSSDYIDDLMHSSSSDHSTDNDSLSDEGSLYNWDAPEVQEIVGQFKQPGKTYRQLDELVQNLSTVMPKLPLIHILRAQTAALRQKILYDWEHPRVKEAIKKFQNSQFYDLGVLSNELSEIMGQVVAVATVRAHLKRNNFMPRDYRKKREEYKALIAEEQGPLYNWDAPEVQEIIEQFKQAGKTYKQLDELVQNLATVMPKVPSINTLRVYLSKRNDAEAFRQKPPYDWNDTRVKEAIKRFQNSEFYDLNALSSELSEIMGKFVSAATVRAHLVRFKLMPRDYEKKREEYKALTAEGPLYNWDAPEVQEIIEQFKQAGKTYKQLDELVQNLSTVMPKVPSIHTLRVYLCRRNDGEAFRQKPLYDWENPRVKEAIETFRKAEVYDLSELSAELSDIMGVIVPITTVRAHLLRFNYMPQDYAKKYCKAEINWEDPRIQLEIKQFFLRLAGYQPNVSQVLKLKKRLAHLMPDKDIKVKELFAYISGPEVRNAFDPYYKLADSVRKPDSTIQSKPTENASKISRKLLKTAQRRKPLPPKAAQMIETFDPSQSTENSTSSDTRQEPFNGKRNNFVGESNFLSHRTALNISSRVPKHEHDYHLLSYWKCEGSFVDKLSAEDFCRRNSTSLSNLKHDRNKILFECRLGNCNCAFYCIRNGNHGSYSVWSKEEHNHPAQPCTEVHSDSVSALPFTEVHSDSVSAQPFTEVTSNHPQNVAAKHCEIQQHKSAYNLDRILHDHEIINEDDRERMKVNRRQDSPKLNKIVSSGLSDNTFKTFAEAVKYLHSSGMYSPKQMHSIDKQRHFKCGNAGCPYMACIVTNNVRHINYSIFHFGYHNHEIISEKDRGRMKAYRKLNSAIQEQNLPKRAKLYNIEAVPEADNNGVPSGSGDGSPEIKPSIQQNSPATLKPEPISEHDETQSVASASTLKSSAMEACESQFSRDKYNWNTAGVHEAISKFQANDSSSLENLFEELATEFLQQTPTQREAQKAGQNQKNTVGSGAKEDFNWNDPKVEEEIRKYYIDIGANNGLLSRHDIVMKRNELAERLIRLMPTRSSICNKKFGAYLRKPEIQMRLDPYYSGYIGDLADSHNSDRSNPQNKAITREEDGSLLVNLDQL